VLLPALCIAASFSNRRRGHPAYSGPRQADVPQNPEKRLLFHARIYAKHEYNHEEA